MLTGPRRVAVVGTGTGIGKTHAAVTLVAALVRQGHSVCGLKPVETGVGPGSVSDATLLQSASSFHVKQPSPYQFAAPVSPHLAARSNSRPIDISTIVGWVDSHVCDCAVIETAGGLLSPLGPVRSNLDLVKALRPEAILLVAPDRLGVLHDVTAALLAMSTLGPELPPAVIVLQSPPTPDTSTGTNAAELLTLGILARAAVQLPREAAETIDAGDLLRALGFSAARGAARD